MKRSINNWIGIGTCVTDTTLEPFTYEDQEIEKAIFTVAVDRNIKDESKQTTDFFECEIIGGRAPTAVEIIKKGNLIYVEGEIRINRFQRQDLTIGYNVKVKVSKYLNLSPKSKENNI